MEFLLLSILGIIAIVPFVEFLIDHHLKKQPPKPNFFADSKKIVEKDPNKFTLTEVSKMP